MPRTDAAHRTIPVPPHEVFAALVDADALATWLPPDGMSGRFEHFDPRPGGSYRLVLTYDDPRTAHGKSSDGTDVVEVRFVDIVEGVRVVQAVDFVSDDPAFTGTMTMRWELREVNGGTRVDIVADDVPAGISAEHHQVGMTSSLANLATHVQGQSTPVHGIDVTVARSNDPSEEHRDTAASDASEIAGWASPRRPTFPDR
jgi:uncharacterized protein YndB with AHSA1/START domain